MQDKWEAIWATGIVYNNQSDRASLQLEHLEEAFLVRLPTVIKLESNGEDENDGEGRAGQGTPAICYKKCCGECWVLTQSSQDKLQ